MPLDIQGVFDGRDLARALTALRENAGLSIRDISRRTSIPSATLGGYYSGRHLPSRPGETLLPILRACGVPDAAFEPWLAALARARRAPGPKPQAALQPYRGLKPFEVTDAEWFFGRERVARRLVERVTALAGDDRSDPETGLLVVTGPSGSGKSSLLRAGLASVYWTAAMVTTPGVEPIAQLAMRLADRSGRPPADISNCLLGVGSLPGWIDEVLPSLLIIDQTEELFTPAVSDAECVAFIAALHRIAAPRPGALRTVVVLGLRSDFYRQASEQPGLVSALQERQIVLGPMTEEELRSAIVEPARRAGVAVDDDLAELLLRDIAASGGRRSAHDPGALPLLSHALMEAWRFAQRGRLSRADYLRTGGIEHAAQQTAEELYKSLSSAEQALARRIFLRLVHVDDAQPLTRRRVSSAELLELSGQQTQIDQILEYFTASRLLTRDSAGVELSHESLIAAWPRLAGWIEQDLASLGRLRQLTAHAEQWDLDGRNDDELLRGGRLEECQRWLDTDPRWEADLNRIERDYLAASALNEQRRLVASRRGIRRTRRLLAAVSALAVVSFLLTGYAFRARSVSAAAEHEAQHQRDLAQSRQLAVEAQQLESTDPALASQLALAAYRVSPTVEARSSLLDSVAVPSPTRLIGEPGPTMIAVSADGRTIALTNAVTGSIQLFGVGRAGVLQRSGLVPGTGKPNQLFALAFAPRSPVLAVGGQDSVVRLWDVRDPGRPHLLGRPLSGIHDAVESVAFSADGRLLAIGGGGTTVWIWDVRDPASSRRLHSLTKLPGPVQSLAFAGSSAILALGYASGLVQRWNLGAPGHPVRLPKLPGPGELTAVQSIAFSPDALLMAVGGKSGTVRIWRNPTATHPVPVEVAIPKADDWINAIRFSPDGRELAIANSDNSLTIWSVAGWQRDRTLPHPGPVSDLAYLPDGSGILSASADGSGHLWRLPGTTLTGAHSNVFAVSYSSAGVLAVGTSVAAGAAQLWTPDQSNSPATVALPAGLDADGTAAISPDGRLLAAGSRQGPISLWTLTPSGPHFDRLLTGPAKLVEYMTFSHDSKLLAVADDDQTVRLWQLSDPLHPQALPPVTGPDSFVYYTAFSPDDHLLAAAAADNTVRLWDISNPTAAKPLWTTKPFASYAMTVTFSPKGKLLAAGGADHQVRLWNITDPARPIPAGQPLTAPDNAVFSVAISPDSRWLAAASTDHTVRLWDISNPAHPLLASILRDLTASAYTVAFSPDGSRLAASGIGGDVHLWPVSIDAAIKQICTYGGDPITPAEWRTYVEDTRYSSPCRPN